MNLGSPDSTSIPDVGVYLREFLMDGRVIDAPFPIRWFIVNCMICQADQKNRRMLTSPSGPRKAPL